MVQKKLKYSILIDKPVDFVFTKIMDKSCYADWAKAWGEGMTYEGNYTKGEAITFFDKSNSGTKALVEDIIPNQHIKMKHIAMTQNGKDVVDMDDMMKKWIGSNEEYHFSEESGKTKLEIEVDTDEAFEGMMQAWDKALIYFKEVCENE